MSLRRSRLSCTAAGSFAGGAAERVRHSRRRSAGRRPERSRIGRQAVHGRRGERDPGPTCQARNAGRTPQGRRAGSLPTLPPALAAQGHALPRRPPEPPKPAARQEPERRCSKPAETSACAEGERLRGAAEADGGRHQPYLGRPRRAAAAVCRRHPPVRLPRAASEAQLPRTGIGADRNRLLASKRLLDPASAVSAERAERVTALAADVAGELTERTASRCSSATGTRTSASRRTTPGSATR